MAAPLPFATSGQRLQALGYVADGAEQFRSMYDSQLGFDCDFALDGAGSDLRCVPTRTAQVIYGDANCTEPATWYDPWFAWTSLTLGTKLAVGDWVSGELVATVGERMRTGEVFELGEQLYPAGIPDGGPAKVYEREGAACKPAYPPGKEFPAVNRLIPHLRSELVAARTVNVSVGGGFSLRRQMAEDGAQLTVEITNAVGSSCVAQGASDCAAVVTNAARVSRGSGALHVDWFVTPGVGAQAGIPLLPVHAAPFFSEGADSCQVLAAADGTLRCGAAEPQVYEDGYWADAACSERLYSTYSNDGLPDTRDPSVFHRMELGDDNRLVALYTLKAHVGAVYHLLNQVCRPTEINVRLLALDRRIEAAELPEVHEAPL